MDKRVYYFKELVADPVLNDGQDFAEAAINSLNKDAAQEGIFQGGVTAEATVPDFTVDVATQLIAYDQQGRRILMPGSGGSQNVDLTNDSDSNPTQPPTGQFRWVSLFILYATVGSEPKTDGNGDVIQTLVQDTFELLIVNGALAGTEGAAVKPTLLANGLLITDVIRRDAATQTAILDADIDQTRTQYTYSLSTSGLSIIAGTQKAALQAMLDELQTHLDDATAVHAASAVSHVPVSNFVATDVQAALDEIIEGAGKEFTGTPKFTDYITLDEIRHPSAGAQTFVFNDSAGSLNGIVSALRLAANEIRTNSGTSMTIASSGGATSTMAVTTGRIVLDEAANEEDVGGSPVAHTLYESAIVKGYGTVRMDTGAFGTDPSLGVASTTVTSTHVTITLKKAMAVANYPVVTSTNDVGFEYAIRTAIAGSFDIHIFDTATGLQVDPTGTTAKDCIFFWMGEEA